MGIFQNKSQPAAIPDDELSQGMQEFFDGYFQELNERGRMYFEQEMQQQAAAFKKDLDTTIAKTSIELKDYLSRRIDEQIARHADVITSVQNEAVSAISQNVDNLHKQHHELSLVLEDQFAQSASAIKTAQAAAIDVMNQSAEKLAEQQRVLSASLQKTVARQDTQLMQALEDSATRLTAMKQAQDTALTVLENNIATLEAQQEHITSKLQHTIEKQQAAMVDGFEENMVTIVEHYLLGALGEAYDLNAQLPAIMKQMEQQKNAMVEDMKL